MYEVTSAPLPAVASVVRGRAGVRNQQLHTENAVSEFESYLHFMDAPHSLF